MKNTTQIYEALKSYQTARSKARDEYLSVKKKYESAKGSPFYDQQLARAKRMRDEAVDAAQTDARGIVDYYMREMRDVVTNRKMAAPTDAQIRILQLLQMRQKLSRSELDAAANALRDIPSGLALLQEIAEKSEIKGTNYVSEAACGLSRESAEELLQQLSKGFGQILDDRVGAARSAVLGAEMNKRLYGVDFDYDDLPQQEAYTDEQSFYAGISNIPFQTLDSTLNGDPNAAPQ